MNLRKKLTFAGVLMILMPLIISLIVSTLFFELRGRASIENLQAMYESDNGLLTVQSILYESKEEILDFDLEDLYEDDEDEEDQEESFPGLTGSLSAVGYYYQISCNDRLILSNLPASARPYIIDMAGIDYHDLNEISIAENNRSIVKRTFTDDSKKMEVIAYCDDYVPGGSAFIGVIQELLKMAVIFATILLVSVVVSIFFLTRWLTKGMQRSLSELTEGVQQIQDGNYSYRINNTKKDELGEACREFDQMAEYLETSLEEQLMYENGRKQMIAGISHDLRTPLTSIKAYVEGLADGMADTEEKKQRYYSALKTRTADLENLVDNLSTFSRYDRGAFHFDMEEINLKDFIWGYFKENEFALNRQGVEVICEDPKGYLPSITGDRQQLIRVLDNLTDNSVKYRTRQTTLITLDLYREGEWLCLDFTDDGPGVPEAEREAIFDSFYRGDQARHDPGAGSGLGLAIVREIMDGHGGSITASTGKDGHGLKMTLAFPLRRDMIPD